MTNYKSGYAFELMVRDYLRARNFTVLRSAGSKGAVDLIAWNGSSCFVIQCKKELRRNGYAEDIAALKAVPILSGWGRQLWVKHKSEIAVCDVDSGVESLLYVRDMNRVVRGER